jgi:aminoglycoside phosphotransferase (APT) family kinase protein
MSTATFRLEAEVNPLDWAALTSYLTDQGHRLVLAEGPCQFAGGMGNWNYLVHLDGRPHVLRRPPGGPLPLGANDMAREFRILSRLGAHFPLAPSAPFYCADARVIGAPFLLIEYRDGVVLRDAMPDGMGELNAAALQLAPKMVDVLVQLHSLDPRVLGLQELGRPEGMVARQARNWTRRANDAWDGNMPKGLARIATWLERPAPQPQRTSLLHSDYKLDNLILARDTLQPVALIDWDMGTLGDPLLDLATLLSYWAEEGDHPAMLALRQMPTAAPGFPKRVEVMALYGDASGLSLEQFSYYRMLALFKLCVVFRQLYLRHRAVGFRGAPAVGFPALVDGLIDFSSHALFTERF